MSTFKKSTKTKFDTETHLLNDSLKKEKVFDDPPVKKVKVDRDIEACGEFRQKTLNLMNRQLRARKQINDKFMKELNEIVANLEADHDALKENEQKVELIAETVVECVKQATAACHEKLEAVTGICLAFKKECEEVDAVHGAEADKLGHELAEDIQKLKQKLIADTKRIARENMEKSFLQVMQNNLK